MAFIFSRASSSSMKLGKSGMRSFVSCTSPKLSPIAATADASHFATKPREWGGEWTPIMVLGVFIMGGVSMGVHTAKQHLCHSPAVQVRKKRREMIYEVDKPDSVVSSADKFVNKSFLRKVAHIQDNNYVPDSGLPNVFTRSREIENLESVGVAYRGGRM